MKYNTTRAQKYHVVRDHIMDFAALNPDLKASRMDIDSADVSSTSDKRW